MTNLEQVDLTFDEIEAIRLADLEGMYQEQAAESMNISRQTFGRIIDSAHKKIAEALVKGKALKIEGGSYLMNNQPLEQNIQTPPTEPIQGGIGMGRRGRGKGRGRCGR